MTTRRFDFKFDREKAKTGLKRIALSCLIGFIVGLIVILFDLALYALIGVINSLDIWIVVCLPIVGLLLCGIITSFFVPEARGHGDMIIGAYHHENVRVRGRLVPGKFLASIATIGFGGSAGPEGPAINMGGGIGSVIGEKINLPLKEKKNLLLYGMSAGFGAIFMAPLSGAVFGCEVLYRKDFDYSNLFPCIVSSGVGFLARKYIPSLFGQENPLIQIPAINYSFNWYDLLLFIGIGVCCGLVGWLFIKFFFVIDRKFVNWKRPEWQKTTLGGVAVSLLVLGLMIFSINFSSSIKDSLLILSLGWPLVNIVGSPPMIFSLEFLILLLIFKLVATCMTLGSGGSGGIVAPSIVMGALLGSIISGIAVIFVPSLSPDMQRAIIVVSSIAVYASIAHVPLTGMLLGGELYGINFIFPALIASVIGSWIIQKHSIYPSAQFRRGELGNPFIN